MERDGKTTRGSPKRVTYHKGGIYARFNKRAGETYYFIRYMGPDGRRRKEKVGTRKQDAKDLLEQRRTEIRLGTWKDPKERASAAVTFSEFTDRFMEEYAVRCRSDHYTDRMKRVRSFFGEILLKRIKRSDIDRFTVERLREVLFR